MGQIRVNAYLKEEWAQKLDQLSQKYGMGKQEIARRLLLHVLNNKDLQRQVIWEASIELDGRPEKSLLRY